MYSRDALRERNPWQGALTSIKRRANGAALGRRRRRRLREKLVQKCATRWKGPQALPTARPLQTDGEIACRPGEARRVRNPGYRMMPSSVALERADYANGCFKNRASAILRLGEPKTRKRGLLTRSTVCKQSLAVQRQCARSLVWEHVWADSKNQVRSELRLVLRLN